MTDNYWILCVDDDEKLLRGLELQLGLDHDVETAISGAAGLELLKARPDCAVVISDMRMPNMNGAEFLAEVRRICPDPTRMLLTGYSEIDNAIAAINEGGIFRFLTKPTSPEVLQTAVSEGIRQWELVRSEKVLLEQTVRGSSESLIEALEIASPVAFSRSRRLESACRHVAQELRFDPVWPVTLAGLFLRLGWIAIPTEVIEARLAGEPSEANSSEMFDEAIATSVRLVGRIPRLGVVAEIIAATAAPSGWLDGPTVVAAVSDFDDLSVLGRSPAEAIQRLKDRYPEEILTAISSWPDVQGEVEIKQIKMSQLIGGMVAQADITARNGQLLARAGCELTETVIQRLRNFASSRGVNEPITVSIPRRCFDGQRRASEQAH